MYFYKLTWYVIDPGISVVCFVEECIMLIWRRTRAWIFFIVFGLIISTFFRRWSHHYHRDKIVKILTKLDQITGIPLPLIMSPHYSAVCKRTAVWRTEISLADTALAKKRLPVLYDSNAHAAPVVYNKITLTSFIVKYDCLLLLSWHTLLSNLLFFCNIYSENRWTERERAPSF